MFVNFVRYSLVIVLSLVYVKSQLCLTRSTVTKHLLFKRWTTIGEAKVIQKCCEGYSQENYNGGVICTPLCKASCMNGYCKKPEECACNAGYSNQNNTCVAICKGECSNGTCIAPDFCLCFPGYKFVNGTCLPRCTKPCGNGTCVATDTCECDDGYYKSTFHHSNTTCQPRCTAGCPVHSYCDAPESCKCNPGWRLNETNSSECLPTCKYPCGNGTCVDKDVCYCFPGFRINYFRHFGLEPGPICESILNYKNCTGVDCVGSHERWLRNNTDTTTTTRNPPILYGDTTTSTTTTRNPTTSTSTTSSSTTSSSTTSSSTTSTSTTTTPYFVSSSSSTEVVLDNNGNNNVTSVDPGDKTWLQRNGIFIWLPILLTLLIIVLLLLRKDIIDYFKGVKNRRSYNVKAAFRKRAASGPFKKQPQQDVKEAQV